MFCNILPHTAKSSNLRAVKVTWIHYYVMYINQTFTGGRGSKPMESWSRENRSAGKAFVKILARCATVEINRTSMAPTRCCSQMKWYTMLICFVRRWNSGLCTRQTALWLLQNNGVGWVCGDTRFASKRRSQILSFTVELAATYSSSVVDGYTKLLLATPKHRGATSR